MQYMVKIIKDTKRLKKGDKYRVSKLGLAYTDIVELEIEIRDKKYKDVPWLEAMKLKKASEEDD